MMHTLAFLAATLFPTPEPGLEWIQVSKERKMSISGMVQLSQPGGGKRFLVVHDNKSVGDPRISFLTSSEPGVWRFQTLPLSDPQKLATDQAGQILLTDLESLCRIPGKEDEFFAIGDKGKEQGWVYRFQIKASAAEIVDAFQVPNVLPDSDYEAFDIAPVPNGKFIAVWADRGSLKRTSVLSAAEISLANGAKGQLGPVMKLDVSVPWPSRVEARAISDLRVSPAGDIYVSSVTDGSDDGPFDSAVYIVAKIAERDGKPHLQTYPQPLALCHTPGYKIEAIDFASNGREFAFGTDDEYLGAAITWYQG